MAFTIREIRLIHVCFASQQHVPCMSNRSFDTDVPSAGFACLLPACQLQR